MGGDDRCAAPRHEPGAAQRFGRTGGRPAAPLRGLVSVRATRPRGPYAGTEPTVRPGRRRPGLPPVPASPRTVYGAAQPIVPTGKSLPDDVAVKPNVTLPSGAITRL
jgi:hypothetical protein